MKKTHLGDGVYVDLVVGGLVLTTEDGSAITNRIYLTVAVYEALCGFVEQLRDENAERILKTLGKQSEATETTEE